MRQGDCFAMSETIQKLPELTEWDVRLMAWHEAGHAVCSFFSSRNRADSICFY